MNEYAPQERQIRRLLQELRIDGLDDPGTKVSSPSGADEPPLTEDEIRMVASGLSALPAAEPPEALTRQLIESLRPHVPEPRFRAQMKAERSIAAGHFVTLLSAVRPQVSAVGRTFWLATALLYAVVGAAGWLLTASLSAPGFTAMIMFMLPLFAVATVGFAFRGTRSGYWEAERASPIDPATLALARFTLVTIYAIGLATILTIAVGVFRFQISLGTLMLSWLAPLLLLASITLFLSVRWNGMTGSLVGFGLWGACVLVHMQRAPFDLFALPGDDFWLAGKMILLALTGALWLIGLPWMRRGLATWRLEVN